MPSLIWISVIAHAKYKGCTVWSRSAQRSCHGKLYVKTGTIRISPCINADQVLDNGSHKYSPCALHRMQHISMERMKSPIRVLEIVSCSDISLSVHGIKAFFLFFSLLHAVQVDFKKEVLRWKHCSENARVACKDCLVYFAALL